jgi:pimeloyl-ACP methyl ester carboxylesterase
MNPDEYTERTGSTPTVVLVHGAFADASIWARVIPELQDAGLTVLAPANPLRGLAADAAYIAAVAAAIGGPVLLAGHSYGGAVITAAGTQAGNVMGLVYVAAFALDEGESALDLAGRFPPSRLDPALRRSTFSDGNGEPGVEVYIARDGFARAFAADLPEPFTTVLAAVQRPIVAAALEEKCPAAAWRSLPSWYLIATADQAIHSDAQRFMARRSGSRTVEVDASHAVALSQPAAVVALIRVAAAVDRPGPHVRRDDP